MNRYTKYSSRYFKDQFSSNKIWASVMGKEGIEMKFNASENLIDYMLKKYRPHKLHREDFEELEISLAEVEIALNKLNSLPERFEVTDEEKAAFIKKYEELCERVERANLQRISWN
ncbi:hypothetical protein SAMN05421663_104174 [Terribacillus halophilus]|uniref:Uncharacterized protein n=1 Tax=Terribacillus halophilus TaxID=361279 RepID=A0A1G6PNN5_9BACI|nr:hypothetical protein [Terribacillus halophilus]SDC80965.1 hypothetical protein SAMN05421663_104174 [Terribacillus halophilus]